MKDFIKMMLATMAGLLLFSVVWMLMMFSFIGSLAALSSDTPVVPNEGVLYMNMSNFIIAEKENPMDVSALMQGNMKVKTLSLLNAIRALNMAAADPGVKFLYMRPDGVSAGIADLEEFRNAILKFRESGKAVISFIENPSNASYYLASAADKVYVTSSKGGMNTVIGLSSRMFFLKDLLDKLGVNMQLIRHGKYKSAGEMYIKTRSARKISSRPRLWCLQYGTASWMILPLPETSLRRPSMPLWTIFPLWNRKMLWQTAWRMLR